jgi:uncharacterized protein YegL
MKKTILVLAANPRNTPPLRLDQEVREIDNGLERAQRRDEFVLKQKWATRPGDVRRAMLDYKPNIVHFCGHGSGPEGIAFEDEMGQANLVSTDALAGFFELFADKVQCVVLNACYSEVQAQAIAKHIPHVIGMNKAIGDSAAIEFAVAFYDALGAGETIEFAYKLARNAIQWSNMAESLTPILISVKHVVKADEDSMHNRIPLQLTPKLPCLLLLDVSGSMNGEPIEALSQGVRSFVGDLKSDPVTIDRVELALITFGSRASIVWDFAPVYDFHMPKLNASGSTAIGEAIALGLDLIKRRKDEYDYQGIPSYRPIVLMLTDGSPTDDWLAAVNRLHKESSLGRLSFITIGIQGADMDLLSQISPPGSKPIELTRFRFREMFSWLSRSISSVSNQSPQDRIELPPADWENI